MLVIAVGFVALLFALALAFYAFNTLFRPWIRALTSGTPVSIISILGMCLRGNPPGLILSAYTSLIHAGDDVMLNEVESVYIANRGLIRNAQDLIDLVRSEPDDQLLSGN